ncbi:MAG TPA: GGDEF domain-containing protein [Chthonomonadales bacterium]|nr:GGDEF domain-containing protein [Chthonomonadales bacterium]
MHTDHRRGGDTNARRSELRLSAATTHSDKSDILKLFEAIEEASTAFLIRYPGGMDGPPPAHLIRDTLAQSVPEPFDLHFIPAEPHTMAVVLTPRNGRAFDPLHVYSIRDQLRSALASLDPSGEDSAEPLILPIAPVSPVTVLKENLDALNEMLETIVNKRLRVQFQPIVSLTNGSILGYEALIRAPQGGALRRSGELFQVAERARLISWFDIACQEICFEQASRNGVRDYLFVNMDAGGLASLHQAEYSLAERATEFNISPSRIVLEITERQAVDDFPRLIHHIEELRAQGVKIAIDDAGAGYSSLHTIAELRPDFVKIDRALTRSLENNGTRRALLATLARYAMQIGASVIAEGIETRDELATVIQCGVPYGQGYLLSRPNDDFKTIRREMRELIQVYCAHRLRRMSGRSYPIGEMARRGVVLPPDTPIEQVAAKFDKNPDLESVVIVLDDRIEGLVMRERFERMLVAQPDVLSCPISGWMDRHPLVIQADTPLEDAAIQATHRRAMSFHHDILVADGSRYVGVVPIRALMEAMTSLQVNRTKYTHPLTGLPGRLLIEQECNRRLTSSRSMVIVRAELERFREFNREFGIECGDEVLLALAHALERAIATCGKGEGFLGHLGGDDFILLLDPSEVEAVCSTGKAQFEALSEHFHVAVHRRQGHTDGRKDVRAVRMGGKTRQTPLFRLRFTSVSSRRLSLCTFQDAMRALDAARRRGASGVECNERGA